MDFAPYIAHLNAGQELYEDKAQGLFTAMLQGNMNEADIEAILRAYIAKPPTVPEIVGAAKAMRAESLKLSLEPELQEEVFDCCGTGGDGLHSYNISTTVAFVLAACDVKVAKHGNRSVSSKSGSSDVLQELGVSLDTPHEMLATCLEDVGLCFMYAYNHHPGMKHIAAVRKKIKERTIFNVLGPLTNPAGAKKQLLGVYDASLVAPMAEVLKALGATNAWVVHGADGADEVSVSGDTYVAGLVTGVIEEIMFDAADYGIAKHDVKSLKGGNAKVNASAMKAVLEGVGGAYRDAVIINTACALYIAQKTNSMEQAVYMATKAIDHGDALRKLNALIAFTHA